VNKISILIPVYNEQESIPILSQQLLDSFQNEFLYEVIFINDGSTDLSLNILKSVIEKNPSWKIVDLYRNYGKAIALQAGFEHSSGSLIATLDSDLQDDPSEISKLVDEINNGYDVVCGWKKNRKDPFEKKIASKIFNFFLRLFGGLRIHDSNTGIKVIKREVFSALKLYGGRHRYIPLLAKQKDFSVSEVIVNHHPRQFGKSKYGIGRYFEGFFDFLTILFLGKYIDRPLHFFGSIGFLSFSTGVLIEFFVLYLKFYQNHSFQQHVALLILGSILIIAGLQLFIFGLLGELFVEKSQKSNKYIKDIIS
jgi:glycosyltransferase involved in cell wall biosynthesis